MARILIVEDDDDIREVVSALLEQEGYDVVSATDGRAALRVLQAGARPDLMLLDLMMPGMNGWEVLERMLSDGLSEIPVVVLTAATTALPAGARELLSKPVHLGHLLDTIRRYVR